MLNQQQYHQIITKCALDESFKQHLLADPRETLKQEGVELPMDVTVKVAVNTPGVINLVIPATTADWNEETLARQTWGAVETPQHINPFFWDGD